MAARCRKRDDASFADGPRWPGLGPGRMLPDIRAAEKRVWLESYILHSDGSGRRRGPEGYFGGMNIVDTPSGIARSRQPTSRSQRGGGTFTCVWSARGKRSWPRASSVPGKVARRDVFRVKRLQFQGNPACQAPEKTGTQDWHAAGRVRIVTAFSNIVTLPPESMPMFRAEHWPWFGGAGSRPERFGCSRLPWGETRPSPRSLSPGGGRSEAAFRGAEGDDQERSARPCLLARARC